MQGLKAAAKTPLDGTFSRSNVKDSRKKYKAMQGLKTAAKALPNGTCSHQNIEDIAIKSIKICSV